jgi:hypothetical protein
MTISFRQLKDLMTGEVSDRQIQYTDEQGTVWTVPLGAGHRFEEAYEAWRAEGNVAAPPD